MLIDVSEVEARGGYILWLKFEDGTEGEVDIKKLLGNFSGVFAKLDAREYFQRVKVDREIGTVYWPDNIDLCPDVLYSAVKGLPKPDLTKVSSA